MIFLNIIYIYIKYVQYIDSFGFTALGGLGGADIVAGWLSGQ